MAIAGAASNAQGRPRSPPEGPRQDLEAANPFGIWWTGRDPPVQELLAMKDGHRDGSCEFQEDGRKKSDGREKMESKLSFLSTTDASTFW